MFTKDDTNRIKGIAIMFLIFHHMYRTEQEIAFMAGKTFIMSDNILSIIASCFRVCVYVFVFLSAFGMSVGINEKMNLFKKYLYRFSRLLMPYWFTLVTINIIYFIVQREFFYPNLLFFLGDVLPVLDIIGLSYNMFSGVFWYMNFTLILVLIMPVIYELTKRFNIIPLILMAIFYRLIPTVVVSPFGGRYASYLFAAGLGVLFQQKNIFDIIQKRFTKLSFAGKGACFLGLVLCASLSTYVGLVEDGGFGFQAILFTTGALAVILIVFLFLPQSILSKPLIILGQFSYDMFLVHLIVCKISIVLLRAFHFVLFQYIAAVGISFLASYALYLLKKYSGWLKLISKVSDKIKAIDIK